MRNSLWCVDVTGCHLVGDESDTSEVRGRYQISCRRINRITLKLSTEAPGRVFPTIHRFGREHELLSKPG